ncbi:MAG: nuclear transport factor 2 family protein, partial [Acidimicrobiia bacterium]|nr:nuclear transport factor 2 family protein [Acidimicrobiia bacterium]
MEERLAAIEAKDEIRELTARYCHAVVDGDVDAIVDLFCSDGTFRMRKFEATGDEELRKMYEGGVGGQTHKPFIQNHVI